MTRREELAWLTAFGLIWLLSVGMGLDAIGVIDLSLWAFFERVI